jgi:hypothetical protein
MITQLTETLINNLTCPVGKSRIECCDKSLPGLYVLVRANSDIKTFYMRYKNALGKPLIRRLGAPPTSPCPQLVKKPKH